MTDCTCPECCEYRAACDEHRACAELVDQVAAQRDRAYADLRQATRRFNAAIDARAVAHNPDNFSGTVAELVAES